MHRAIRWIPWVLVLGSALFLGYVWQDINRPAPEPVYHGRTLRQWTAALRQQDISKRLTAIRVLGSLGDQAKPAVPDLVRTLEDDDPGVRWSAARALVRIGEGTDAAIPVLVDSLGIRLARLEAAQLLVRVGKPAVPALCQEVDDPRSPIRLAAIEILRDLGPDAGAAVPHLLPVLNQAPLPVRRETARALGRIGNADAAAALIDQLGDPVMEIRLACHDALVQLGVSALPALRHALQTGRNRAGAARVLAHIGPPARDTEELLRPALTDDDPQVRQESARAIVLVGGDGRPGLPILFAALQDRSFRWDALDALVKVGEPAVPVLIPALRDPDEIVRGDTARALGQLGPHARQAVPALADALRDPDRSVRREAVAALGRIGAAAQDVLPAMIELCKDPDPLNRAEVAIALTHLGPAAAPAVPNLIDNLADDDESVRQESAKALAAIGPAAVAGLRISLHHDNEAVRVAAAELLRRIE